MQPIIQIINLNKTYGKIQAVNNLHLEVMPGEIFGFLGPNGSGKSTSIRMMLTLIKPDSGDINFFGKKINEKRNEILRNIGALVEKPDFYLYLSAFNNLAYFGALSLGKKVSKSDILDILELVGLKDRAYSKVKTFSLGMKQRLGIAQALLHNPDLIILDEPTNGLDPQGMKEIRELLMDLAKNKGKTIFISSHILPEIETIADSMAIINQGKNVVQGKVAELLSAGKHNVTIEVNDPEKTKQLIANSNLILINSDSNSLTVEMNKNEIPTFNKYLVENGIEIYSINPIHSLEEYFLNITQGSN